MHVGCRVANEAGQRLLRRTRLSGTCIGGFTEEGSLGRNRKDVPTHMDARQQHTAAVHAARDGRCALPSCTPERSSSSSAAAAAALLTAVRRTRWRTGSATSARTAAKLRPEDPVLHASVGAASEQMNEEPFSMSHAAGHQAARSKQLHAVSNSTRTSPYCRAPYTTKKGFSGCSLL